METNTPTVKRTVKFSTMAAYGAGGMGCYSMLNTFLSYYGLFFLTNVAGFSAVAAASLYSIIQFMKIVTMTASGVLIDSTSLKFGKFRSWILIGCVICVAASGAIFLDYSALGQTAHGVLYVLFFVLCNLGYNLMWSSIRSIVGPMSKNSVDSISLNSAAQISSSIAGVIYGVVSAPLLAFYTAKTKIPYSATMYTFAILIVLGTILMLHITKPYDTPQAAATAEAKSANKKKDQVSLLDMLKNLKGQGLIFFVGTTIGNVQSGFFSALLVYFTTYVLQNPAVMGYTVTFSTLGSFLGGLFAPSICTKLGKRNSYILAKALSAGLYVATYLFGTNAVVFLAIRCILGFVGSFGGASIPAMGTDLADYNEMHGQKSARAFVQSMVGASIRIGTLVSSSISSFGLAALGYVSGTTPSPEVLDGIIKLMAIGPATVCIISGAIMCFYKVTEKELDEYRARKAAEAQQ